MMALSPAARSGARHRLAHTVDGPKAMTKEHSCTRVGLGFRVMGTHRVLLQDVNITVF